MLGDGAGKSAAKLVATLAASPVGQPFRIVHSARQHFVAAVTRCRRRQKEVFTTGRVCSFGSMDPFEPNKECRSIKNLSSNEPTRPALA